MDATRLTVALTIDHDAISDSIRRGDSPVKFSHAEFGPRVGAKRILELLASRAIPATWFVPGHTLTTFTDDTDAILAGGHELACHGWFHEDFAELGDQSAPAQVMVNEEFVRRFVGAGEVLNRRLENGGKTYVITGVVKNALYEAYGEAAAPIMYFS